MALVSEWLKLIPSIIQNRELILDGIVNNVKKNFGTLPEDEQNEIIRRRAICAACPFMSNNAKVDGDYVSDRPDPHCIMCGCSINLKTASLLSNCGIEKFNKQHPDAKLELKWEKYDKTS